MSGVRGADGDLAGNEAPPPGTDAEPELVGVELMDLPDDMLIEIFVHLDDEEELLRLRAVCRRWRDLLLHPDVWRRRELWDIDERQVQVVAVVLRSQAPCLDTVKLGTSRLEVESLCALAASTSCAVKKLEFCFDDDSHVGLAALVIHNQAALGRLREVAIERLHPSYPLSSNHRLLLDTLSEAEGLTTLDFDLDYEEYLDFGAAAASWAGMEHLPCPVPPRMAKSSLTKFVCSAWLPDAVLESFLKCHAATLEDVDLECLRPGCRLPVAALLFEVPRLRKLRCAMLPDMAQLTECPALKTLTLVLADAPPGRTLKDAKAFLRSTTRLETLRLRQYSSSQVVIAVVVDLLATLATNKGAAVKSIAFDWVAGGDYDPPPLHFGLGVTLFSFPRLRSLDVSQFALSSAFFEAVTPGSAPSLRWLKVDGPPDGVCAHGWFHGAPVSDMLRRNPSLHLQYYYFLLRLCKAHDGSACEYCRWGCHKTDAKSFPHKTITVFAHPHKGGPCSPCGEKHGNKEFWFELI